MGGGSHAPNSPVAAFAVPVDKPQHLDEDISAIDAVSTAIENFLSLPKGPEGVVVEEQFHAPVEPDIDDTSSMLANPDADEESHLSTDLDIHSSGMAEVKTYLAKLKQDSKATLTNLSTNWAELFDNSAEHNAFLDRLFQKAGISADQRESLRDALRKKMDAHLATATQESPHSADQSKVLNVQSYRGANGESGTHTRHNASVTGYQSKAPYLRPQAQGSNAVSAAWAKCYHEGIGQAHAQSRQNASVTWDQPESAATGPREVKEPYLPQSFDTQAYVPSSFDYGMMSPLPGFSWRMHEPYVPGISSRPPPPPGFGWPGYEPYAPDTFTRPPFNFPDPAFPGLSPSGNNHPEFTATAPKIKQTLRWTASDSRRTQRRAHNHPVAGTEQQQQDREVSEQPRIHKLALFQENLEKLRDMNLKKLIAMRETRILYGQVERGLPSTLDSPTLLKLPQEDLEDLPGLYEGGDRDDYEDLYSGLDDLDYDGYGIEKY